MVPAALSPNKMSLIAEENFIRANLSSLLLARELKAKTEGPHGAWNLHEIHFIHATPRNIEFRLMIENNSAYLRVSAKINRKTKRFSNLKVEDF
jgi:hypothetical protein